jgi:hypothetical protein
MTFAIPTHRVIDKASGHEYVINQSDFNPDLHDLIEEDEDEDEDEDETPDPEPSGKRGRRKAPAPRAVDTPPAADSSPGSVDLS